jgi:hypothetical protein
MALLEFDVVWRDRDALRQSDRHLRQSDGESIAG